jgi:predicted metal-dependent peptidase
MKKIEKSIRALLESKPFYAYFFLDSKVEYDKYNVATAGAVMTARGPLLIFNSTFMESLTHTEVSAVIEHEVLHLLFDHVSAHKADATLNKKIANVAMDASINQFIENLPKECISVEKLNTELDLQMELGQTWEYYYAKLMQKQDEMGGKDSFDDHELETGEEAASGEQKAALRSTVDRALKAAKGNAPSVVLKVFDSLKDVSKVPWQQVLSNFIARSTSSTNKNTRKKINRRFGLEQPGKKKKRELVLGVCVDSSGSVSDESFQSFLAEVSRISQICSITYIIDADCAVQNVEVVKKGKPIKRERRGGGGTAYQPAIDECMKRNCDAILYFGDFDCADTPTNPGIPFLWVGVGESKKPGDFGAEIRL